jgi:hypothetical protein
VNKLSRVASNKRFLGDGLGVILLGRDDDLPLSLLQFHIFFEVGLSSISNFLEFLLAEVGQPLEIVGQDLDKFL